MNIQRIDYRLLRSFLVVARIENFVRAAEALNITQSALSQQMRSLQATSIRLYLNEKAADPY